MCFEVIEDLCNALKEKEDEDEKRRNEQRAKDELKRKANVLSKYGGKTEFLVEHGFGFDMSCP